LFTKEELQEYSESNKGLYLAILGKVYDVGKGEKFYASGGNYHFFTGRDGSRAFITGDFTDSGLTDDVTGLTVKELINLHEWAQYYHKEYKYKGKVIGRYYDDEGQPTSYYHQVKKLINKAKRTKEEQDKEKLSYPPCNAEWSLESGSRVWCSTRSGGIERDWIGVPRQLYDPGSHTYRCICIRENETDGPNKKGNIKEYPECNPKSTSCWVHS
ncbi:Cytochrome b5 domain-containing protein 2, partial [Zootermopsis nevadensis]